MQIGKVVRELDVKPEPALTPAPVREREPEPVPA